jgi:tetratricopeptide (TPR) repeat protein
LARADAADAAAVVSARVAEDGPDRARGGAQAQTVEARDAALKAALAAATADPRPGTHRAAAVEYVRLGILDLALRHLERARRLDSRDPDTHDALARLWRDMGVPQMALSEAYHGLHYSRGSPRAHNTLGTVLQSLGRRAEARLHYARAADLDPGAAYAWNNLCYVSTLDGRLDEAIAACWRAVQLNPGLTAGWNNLGLAYAVAGDLAAARGAFEPGGGPAAASFNIGIVQLARGQYTDAAASFDEASRLEPALREARVRWQQASALAGEGQRR